MAVFLCCFSVSLVISASGKTTHVDKCWKKYKCQRQCPFFTIIVNTFVYQQYFKYIMIFILMITIKNLRQVVLDTE